MSESELQFRMLLQIADRSNTELARAIAPHDQGIRVVKPERLGHADCHFTKSVRDLRNSYFIAAFQDLLDDRAGVLRISVDLSAAQRFPKNDRPAHALPVLGRNSGVTQRAVGNFAEDIGLGEFLGTDDDGLRIDHGSAA